MDVTPQTVSLLTRLWHSLFESEAVRLTSVNIAHQLPSQLNELIPVDPEETLLQRLPKPMPDSSVKLKRRTEQVSDAFPNRSKKYLQIIVTLRGTFSALYLNYIVLRYHQTPSSRLYL